MTGGCLEEEMDPQEGPPASNPVKKCKTQEARLAEPEADPDRPEAGHVKSQIRLASCSPAGQAQAPPGGGTRSPKFANSQRKFANSQKNRKFADLQIRKFANSQIRKFANLHVVYMHYMC